MFASCKSPTRAPQTWGKFTRNPFEHAPGIWLIEAEYYCGMYLSTERHECVCKQFPMLEFTKHRFYTVEDFCCYVVATFPGLFPAKACYKALWQAMANAQWDQQNGMSCTAAAAIVMKSPISKVAEKYAADNSLVYMVSGQLPHLPMNSDTHMVVRMVRKSDGKAITVCAPRYEIRDNKYFNEAQVSFWLVAPDV